MAVFGTFADITPDEVLGLVKNKEGILEIENNIKIFIRDGQIVGMTVGDRVLDTRSHYLAILTDIISDNRSRFRFEKCSVIALGEPVPVDIILLESAVRRDEMDMKVIETIDPDVPFFIPDDSMDRVRQIFSRTGNNDLYAFLRDSYHVLVKGATAREVSERLGYPLMWVRYMLAILRAMKVIAVKRRERKGDVMEALRSVYQGLRKFMRRFSRDGQDI